jgi:hypothetical protein
MESDLQSLLGLNVQSCTHLLIPPPPAFGHIYEGAIGQPRYTTSLCDPQVQIKIKKLGFRTVTGLKM